MVAILLSLLVLACVCRLVFTSKTEKEAVSTHSDEEVDDALYTKLL